MSEGWGDGGQGRGSGVLSCGEWCKRGARCRKRARANLA
jgi:hypothetical protein